MQTMRERVNTTTLASPRIIKKYQDLAEHEREFFDKVFANNWNTKHIPSLPVMKKAKIDDTAIYVGKWNQNLPFANKKGTEEQNVLRRQGRPAYMKVIVDPLNMKVEFKIVDALGCFANAQFVKWENGHEFNEELAFQAALKAERTRDKPRGLVEHSGGCVFKVRTRLCSFAKPPSKGMIALEAGSPTKPTSGKRKKTMRKKIWSLVACTYRMHIRRTSLSVSRYVAEAVPS
ncbi:hypothetical protein B0H66DRAFT_606706 [Apodospora peruviana]|uniref:Uncharacterized protein n=1 Tax=Apodospora peruviana TaxID=516989 RepID=A0AAE0LZI8_9PEZI|nr:hypothetical protein B0H66DRAFT_606706 [Apodospora peruviana]